VTQHPPEIDRYIRRELPNLAGKRILDVGCGRGGIGYLLRTHPGGTDAEIVGVDVHEPYLDFCRRFRIYDELIHADASTYDFDQFNIVIACEVLEHLDQERSLLLLKRLESIASELVLVSTPNGPYLRGAVDGVDSEAHLSVWNAAFFMRRGYSVRGIGNRWWRYGNASRLQLAIWYMTTPLAVRWPAIADTIIASIRPPSRSTEGEAYL
jgi:SAM-dependent methyltransferase